MDVYLCLTVYNTDKSILNVKSFNDDDKTCKITGEFGVYCTEKLTDETKTKKIWIEIIGYNYLHSDNICSSLRSPDEGMPVFYFRLPNSLKVTPNGKIEGEASTMVYDIKNNEETKSYVSMIDWGEDKTLTTYLLYGLNKNQKDYKEEEQSTIYKYDEKTKFISEEYINLSEDKKYTKCNPDTEKESSYLVLSNDVLSNKK